MLTCVEIERLGSPDRKTLVVLGAGASRGASFAKGAMLPPPVDRDFFQILQMSKTGRTEDGRALLDHVRDAYGPALDIGMETVFSNLDAAKTFAQKAKIDPGPTPSWPEKTIDRFRRVLPELLRETIGSAECTHHLALARQLTTIDNVVSLNYDCLIDRALCEAAGSRFAAKRGGYGVEVSSGAEEWRGTAKGRAPKGSITLLKLHGSLNWGGDSSPLPLRSAIYKEVPKGVIQPPLTNKPITAEPFRTVWREARRSVRSARRLILIGYSMPIADGLVRSLLWTDLTANLAEVIVVEPEALTRNRHVEFFTRRAKRPKVFVFSSFEDLATVLE
jgi:hypothetical protein